MKYKYHVPDSRAQSLVGRLGALEQEYHNNEMGIKVAEALLETADDSEKEQVTQQISQLKRNLGIIDVSYAAIEKELEALKPQTTTKK